MQPMDHWLHQITYLESLGVHILNLFANIVKIDGVHKCIDKGMHSIHTKTKFVNLFDENEHGCESQVIPMSLAMQTFTFRNGSHLQLLILMHQQREHANCLMSKVNQIRN